MEKTQREYKENPYPLQGNSRIMYQKQLTIDEIINAKGPPRNAAEESAPWENKTLYDYIVAYIDQDSSLGDLARDVMQDSDFPRGHVSVLTVQSYLKSKGALDRAIDALYTIKRLAEAKNRVGI